MKKFSIIYILAVSALLVGCGGDASSEAAQKEEKKCLFSYNHGSSDLTWTAFKTNDTLPVKGGFNIMSVVSSSAYTAKEVIESLQFTIETNSVETNDEARNKKIDSLFFGYAMTPQIKGKIRKLNDNGKCVITINMHQIDIDIEGDYALKGSTFTFDSEINLLQWNMIGAADNLNKECKDLHAGKDKVSKLWSNVRLSFTTTLKSDCDSQ